MKKLMLALMALLMTVGLAACGDPGEMDDMDMDGMEEQQEDMGGDMDDDMDDGMDDGMGDGEEW